MKLHYPHTTLTGKDLAKGFARADRQVAELSASLEYTHQDAHVDVVIREIYQDEDL